MGGGPEEGHKQGGAEVRHAGAAPPAAFDGRGSATHRRAQQLGDNPVGAAGGGDALRHHKPAREQARGRGCKTGAARRRRGRTDWPGCRAKGRRKARSRRRPCSHSQRDDGHEARVAKAHERALDGDDLEEHLRVGRGVGWGGAVCWRKAGAHHAAVVPGPGGRARPPRGRRRGQAALVGASKHGGQRASGGPAISRHSMPRQCGRHSP